MSNVLDRIVARKREEIAAAKARCPERELEKMLDQAPPVRGVEQWITLRGGDSLALFRHDAETRNVRFLVHHSTEMALDLDEPDDLERLRRAV